MSKNYYYYERCTDFEGNSYRTLFLLETIDNSSLILLLRTNPNNPRFTSQRQRTWTSRTSKPTSVKVIEVGLY